MWVEFVVGSLLFSERFFSGCSGFPLSLKTNNSKFQFDQESGRRRTTLWMCYFQIIIYLFIYLFILPWKVRTWQGLDPRRSFRLLILWESARFVATIPLKVATAEISFCSSVRHATHRDTYLNLRSEDVALLYVGNIFEGRLDSCPFCFTVCLAH